MRNTDPARWEPVFAEYPGLTVDFAHFGERWLPPPRGVAPDSWTRAIVSLMERYPGVYADLSFNGSDPEYWPRLARFLGSLGAAAQDRVRSRLMFGTDFFISLTKSRSYLYYVKDFEESPVDGQLKRAMASETPSRFLFGD